MVSWGFCSQFLLLFSHARPADLYIVCCRAARKSIADLQIVYRLYQQIFCECLQKVCRTNAEHPKNVCRPDHLEFVRLVLEKKNWVLGTKNFLKILMSHKSPNVSNNPDSRIRQIFAYGIHNQ